MPVVGGAKTDRWESEEGEDGKRNVQWQSLIMCGAFKVRERSGNSSKL